MEQFDYHACRAFQKDLMRLYKEAARQINTTKGCKKFYHPQGVLFTMPLVGGEGGVIAYGEVTFHTIYDYGSGRPGDYVDDSEWYVYSFYADGTFRISNSRYPMANEKIKVMEPLLKAPMEAWIQQIKFHFDRAKRKTQWSPVHEELAAKMWAPERVAAFLERGGWDLIDAL